MAQAKKSTATKAKKKPAPKAKAKVAAAKKTKASKAKKAAPKKATAPKKAPKKSVDLSTLDRKGLAQRARQLKLELLGIRFNLQAPSLKEYRLKRQELNAVLGQLK